MPAPRRPLPAKASSLDLAWFLVTLAAFALAFACLDHFVGQGLGDASAAGLPLAHGWLRLGAALLLVSSAFILPKWRAARR